MIQKLRRWYPAFFFILVLCAGCSEGAVSPTPSTEPSPTPSAEPPPANTPTPTVSQPTPTAVAPTPTVPAGNLDDHVSFEAVLSTEEMVVGDPVELNILAINDQEFPVTFWYGGSLIGFKVTHDQEGDDVVWEVSGATAFLAEFTLPPGDRRLFTEGHSIRPVEWDARQGGEGFPVPPGEYWVRGVVRAEFPFSTSHVIETEPQRLTIDTPPIPEYVEMVDVELEVPDTAGPGEEIITEMVVTNSGEQPAFLNHGGTHLAGPGLYFHPNVVGNRLDVVVFKDGEVVWRAAPAHGLDGHYGQVVLGPGESMTMGELFEGESWSWDQRDAAGNLVEPGTYDIRGVVALSLEDAPHREITAIATGTHQLEIGD
ncbi:MAG: hypothetical protein WD533_03785 [Dehalococcoidia bacterium]